MSQIFKAISLSLLLVACGSNNTNTASTSSNSNNLTDLPIIPTNAQITDYSCETVEDYSSNGTSAVYKSSYAGLYKTWSTEDGLMHAFDESSDDVNLKQYQKIKKVVIDDTSYKKLIEVISWNKNEKRKDIIERTYSNNNVIKNIVNGEDRPYYWTTVEMSQISEKTFKSVSRHTNPSIRNNEGRIYTSIIVTCIDKDR